MLTLQVATVGHQSRHAEGATVGAIGSAAETLQPGFHGKHPDHFRLTLSSIEEADNYWQHLAKRLNLKIIN